MRRNLTEYIKEALFRVIIGDALGFPYEFVSREEIRKDPITNFKFPNHIFTDDSSLTLCTIEALLENDFDLSKIAYYFQKWFNEGYWSPDGESRIGIGMTVAQALRRM